MFTLIIVLVALGLLCLVGGLIGKAAATTRDGRTTGKAFLGIGVAALILAGIFLPVASYNKVPTNNVGIVTTYSKPTGQTVGAGVHWLAPWSDIQDWDATRQPYNYLGSRCEKPGDGGLWVTISEQRQACIRVQINWESTRGDAAVRNWSSYKKADNGEKFTTFVEREVDPAFNDAILATFRDFDPLSLIQKDGSTKAPDLAGTYTQKLKDEIDKRMGTTKPDKSAADLTVMSISWGSIGYDAATANLISQHTQKILEGRNLDIDKSNAATRAGIAKSTGIDAATQQCLDLIKLMGKGEPGLCMGSGVTLTKPVG